MELLQFFHLSKNYLLSWVRAPNGSQEIIRKKLNINSLRIFRFFKCTTFAPLGPKK